MADSVEIVGFAELQALLAKLGASATDTVKRQLAMSGFEMETEAKKNLTDVGGVDVGKLRASTHYRPSDGGLGAEVAAPNPEAAAVEMGTAPAGALKQHMPPSAALAGWVRRHGMPESAAFLVARAIKLRGIRARPWMSTAHTTIAPKFVKDLTAKLNQLVS